MGFQTSRPAGAKVTKNGMSDCGWVALGGSLLNCTTDISNIFGGYVSRDIWQHHAYIYETKLWRIKKFSEGHLSGQGRRYKFFSGDNIKPYGP